MCHVTLLKCTVHSLSLLVLRWLVQKKKKKERKKREKRKKKLDHIFSLSRLCSLVHTLFHHIPYSPSTAFLSPLHSVGNHYVKEGPTPVGNDMPP